MLPCVVGILVVLVLWQECHQLGTGKPGAELPGYPPVEEPFCSMAQCPREAEERSHSLVGFGPGGVPSALTHFFFLPPAGHRVDGTGRVHQIQLTSLQASTVGVSMLLLPIPGGWSWGDGAAGSTLTLTSCSSLG